MSDSINADDLILVEHFDKVLKLTINRPDRKNALNQSMYIELANAMRSAPEDGFRVVFLCGSNENFTSGNDLGDFAAGADISDTDNPIAQFIFALHECPLPIVVAVQGVAVGIGTTLLLHSDLVYADTSARFQLPFVNLGLCPEFASSLILPRLVGHVKAAEWLLLGEFFDATAAVEAKLINAIVEDPIVYAHEQAQKLAAKPPQALQTTKSLMKAPLKAKTDSVIREEVGQFGRALKGPEFAEAVAAFFEKRTPNFK